MQISCSTASTALIDRDRFRRYFQLAQTMADISRIYEGLINHYDWRYVSLITQNENLWTVVSSYEHVNDTMSDHYDFLVCKALLVKDYQLQVLATDFFLSAVVVIYSGTSV